MSRITFWLLTLIVIVAAVIISCTEVKADPCVNYSCKPATIRTYSPTRTYNNLNQEVIIVDDVVFLAFDPRAKDIFFFPGPPLASQPGLTLGIDVQGREVPGVPVAPVTQGQVQQQVQPITTRASRMAALELAYKKEANSLTSSNDANVRTALNNSCGKCHGNGVAKGGFSISGNIDWATVLDAVTPNKAGVARMPKDGAPLSEAVRSQISELVKRK